MKISSGAVTRDDTNLREERCPKCKGLLFCANAEGFIEIKCRKCHYMVRRKLKRDMP
jgi:phage FluMu protein Com